MMHPDNLGHLYNAVAVWNKLTRELQELLEAVYVDEGYNRHEVVAEAIIIRCLLSHLEASRDIMSGSMVELLKAQPIPGDG